MDRGSGVLLHVSSLPSPYGIGAFDAEAFKFIDKLNAAGFKYWQMLPLVPTDCSPYMGTSLFAGNPYFVDLSEFFLKRWIGGADLQRDWGDPQKVDFDKLAVNRIKVLRTAYSNGIKELKDELKEFGRKNKRIYEFALFMAIKTHFNGKPWYEWDAPIANYEKAVVEEFKKITRDETEFWLFTQYFFFKQFAELKKYSASKGVKLFGDFPFYPSLDSADVWANRELFIFDGVTPKLVAGVPPDYFSSTGQLWGNPVYNFKKFEETNYTWLKDRMKAAGKMFDLVRIDHFRGFESFWAVPYGSTTAAGGQWMEGLNREALKRAMKLSGCAFAAEDLGTIDEKVLNYRDELKLPGMNVLQFAFSEDNSKYLVHSHLKNSISYIGTHDNNTLKGWLHDEAQSKEWGRIADCLGFDGSDFDVFFRYLSGSACDVVIFTMQDLLKLGGEFRMNTPGTVNGNWAYRMGRNDFSERLVSRFCRLNRLYGR